MANEVFDGNIQTLQISTGNVATVNDPFQSGLPIGQGQFGSPNGARNPVGEAAYISDGTIGSGTGRRWKVRYVRMNATTINPTPVVGPVYWKDNTFQVVTTLASEAPATLNGCAGILLNPNITNGNYCFILVLGFIGAANIGSMVVGGAAGAGGLIVPLAGQQLTTTVAAGTYTTTYAPIGYLMTAIGGGTADVFINIET